ncbi:MAG: hypothetical protein EOR30_17695 [Mesorhizobium sp.]|uniref:hypothetical protein n=1 Tax=unclassified Mesorhizobium TaxID=325217 RepID=UPI000FCA5CD4|nr:MULTISPECIES: hypothetical protein [unclassified Mesorhizobium]RUV73226.1 hypothetical protein EOA78_12515 [Mesorhizobium sp. M5C.F.Cr.IN.023.01.1.1]RWF86649.1 MAG: hypothetical protein EOQ36_16440 [Mesorhizobium sp.]RWF95390.1 MAG: hypothetical protein EOQ45_08760 [Mesorhizobium sp.]RWI39772.1 MAG: hypothetical protein EOR14_16890 [Mesorhizobium sp.]RWI45361.1 MAG: hypothetical protein EOR15_23150 [Mesorhizobium sp.]
MTRKVIVIAFDDALRRSIAFLLEAEGFEVSSHQTLHQALETAKSRRRCAIIDEDVLSSGQEVWNKLRMLADCVVVLLSKGAEFPPEVPVHYVEKPLLGRNLVQAVETTILRLSSFAT